MSLEAKQIHPAVQKALYRKIDALNRIRLGTNEPFYTKGSTFDVQKKSNPIEQQMARMCWARVTAGVVNPEAQGEDGVSDQPIYFSSFIEQSNTFDIKNANRPLTYNKNSSNLGESKENIYRGETGITSVQVDQLSFFIKKMTISFFCPDPVDFEKTIQPTFLRHGQYCAVEFGWGMNDSDIDVPPLSFADIQKLNSSIKERNLGSAGNYQCDVGIVSNYTFELNTDGGYEGTIDILTRGQNVLNQTSQNSEDISRDPLSVKGSVNNLEKIADYDKLTEDEKKFLSDEQLEAIEAAKSDLEELKRAQITYKKTMMNLEGILDQYLKDAESAGKVDQKVIKNYGDEYGNINSQQLQGSIKYRFKNGVLKTYASGYDVKVLGNIGFTDRADRKVADDYYISWGWFEDHILNSFFSAEVNIKNADKTGKQQKLQTIRSVSDDKIASQDVEIPNKCHISEYLYSKGLDTVILPNKTHQSAFDGSEFKFFKKGEQIKQVVVRAVFEIINENFKSFIPTEILYVENPGSGLTRKAPGFPKDCGIIRNMVFPISKFRLHFENMETLKQGLRGFWADVQNEYGGFWSFGIGQDQEDTGRVGVFDSYYNPSVEKVDLFMLENQSTREEYIDWSKGKEDPKKIFTFPVYSKNSIVKDFGLTVKMSSKAATIAVYGGNTNIATGTQRSSDLQDLSLQAYSLLLNPTRKPKTAGELANDLQVSLNQGMVTQMKFPIDDDMIGTGTAPSLYKEDTLEAAPINESGIDFTKIPEVNPTTREVLERILGSDKDNVPDADAFFFWYDNKKTGATRFYDNAGNMKSEYVKTMLHLINNSLYEGDDSNIQTRKVVIPIDIDMTIDGVGGLRPFDLFRVDYLPEIYRNFTYFQIFNVGHTITPAGWETNITAKMKLDLEKFKKKYGSYIKPARDAKSIAIEFQSKEDFQKKLDLINTYQTSLDTVNNQILILNARKEILEKFKNAEGGPFQLQSIPQTDEVENRELKTVTITPKTYIQIEIISPNKYRIITLGESPFGATGGRNNAIFTPLSLKFNEEKDAKYLKSRKFYANKYQQDIDNIRNKFRVVSGDAETAIQQGY